MDWQSLIVGAVVLASAGYLLRTVFGSVKSSGCGCKGGCGADKKPGVVQITLSAPPTDRRS